MKKTNSATSSLPLPAVTVKVEKETEPSSPSSNITTSKMGNGSGPVTQQTCTVINEHKPISLSKLMQARAQRNQDCYQATGIFSFELHRQSNQTDSKMPESPVDQSNGGTKSSTNTSLASTNVPHTMGPHARTMSTSSSTGSLMNGVHSPHSVNGTPSPPATGSAGPTPSATSLSNQELPPACGARQLSKLKRFLTTLQQFGTDISPEIGERVRSLVMGLVNNALSVEEFHNKLQEATNFPLRPFVIPFLKANLPLLQRELMHCARLAKVNPQQYYLQNEQQILEVKSTPDPADSSITEVNENGKRRSPDERMANRPKENGSSSGVEVPLPKRHHGVGSPTALPAGYPPSRESLFPDPFYFDDRIEDEWKHVETMLQCIVGMVEKTKRALAVLHQRSIQDREELALWARRHSQSVDRNFNKRPPSGEAAISPVEDRVTEVKRRAGTSQAAVSNKMEEAVNEVKRQAVSELQKAVAAAEQKANEMVSAERAKLDQSIVEARQKAAEEAVSLLNQQEDSSENCWNCGRKANETCSGCNTARYCGSFCQHKDWENHHRMCSQYCNQQSKPGSSNNNKVGIPETTSASSSSSSSSTTATTTSCKIGTAPPTVALMRTSPPSASPTGSHHSTSSPRNNSPNRQPLTVEGAR
ncbi:protein CBFA2T2-like isoform X5 [Apostichopus japonicus]|uniref:protein CBFA2T2-like isoform X5 n=1 Tax=Stichopus japonicus TaxID=307972 RepID=UPI003AB4CA89